jgi:fumarate hydratase class I
MATPPEFKYQPMFPLGPDTTEYYLLTKDYVSVGEFEGKPILKVAKEGLTMLANTAFRDVSFMLRRSHNEQVAKILSDPEASDNDKYVALTFLRNADVAAKACFLSARIRVRLLFMAKKVSRFGPVSAMKKLLSKGCL